MNSVNPPAETEGNFLNDFKSEASTLDGGARYHPRTWRKVQRSHTPPRTQPHHSSCISITAPTPQEPDKMCASLNVLHAIAEILVPHSYSQSREQRESYMFNIHIYQTSTKKEMLPSCEIKTNLSIFTSVTNIHTFI